MRRLDVDLELKINNTQNLKTMLLVPSTKPLAANIKTLQQPRYVTWSDGTCVAIAGSSFWVPHCCWTFVDARNPALLNIKALVLSPHTNTVFAIFQNRSGVFACPQQQQEIAFCETLGAGKLHQITGAFSANAQTAVSTCLDCFGSMLVAGDAWGRLGVWDLGLAGSSSVNEMPPISVIGAHGKLGCLLVRFAGNDKRVVSVGGMRNEIKVWDLHEMICMFALDSSVVEISSITTSTLHNVLVVAAGLEDGRLLLWNCKANEHNMVFAFAGNVPCKVECVVEYRGLLCCCDSEGRFGAIAAHDGKIVRQGQLPAPFVGIVGNALIMDFCSDVSVQELVRWGKPETTKPAAAASMVTREMTQALKSIKVTSQVATRRALNHALQKPVYTGLIPIQRNKPNDDDDVWVARKVKPTFPATSTEHSRVRLARKPPVPKQQPKPVITKPGQQQQPLTKTEKHQTNEPFSDYYLAQREGQVYVKILN